MDGCFLTNHWSGRRLGDPGFSPCFETLEEYPTLFEMLFIQSDEGHALVLLIPKRSDIDQDLRSLCAKHATTAQELSS